MIGMFMFIFVANIFCSYTISVDNNPINQSSLFLTSSAVTTTQSDTYLANQWGLSLTGALQAHGLGITGDNGTDPVVIAVLDSGVDITHPDLDGNWLNNTDFSKPAQGVQDDTAHGTHVAGIICAEGNNGVGVRGVAPGAKFFSFKVIGSGGVGDTAWMINALDNLSTHHPPSLGETGLIGVDIVSMSIGTIPGDIPLPAQRQAIQAAVNKCLAVGMILVAAAGNYAGTPDGINYPAVCDGVISVGAINKYEIVTTYSEYGADLDFVSCGGDATNFVYSTFPILNGSYGQMVGTSQATPHLSGLIALLLASGQATNNTIYDVLKAKCKDLGALGRDNFYGWGFPQIYPEQPYYMEFLVIFIISLVVGIVLVIIPGRKE